MGHPVRSGKSTALLPVVGALLLSATAILTSCGGDEQPQLETEVTFTPNTETTKLQTLTTTSASPTNSGTYSPPPSTSGVTPTTTTFVGTPSTTATVAPTTTTTPPVSTEPDQNAPGG